MTESVGLKAAVVMRPFRRGDEKLTLPSSCESMMRTSLPPPMRTP
jgi:hypothetical protein